MKWTYGAGVVVVMVAIVALGVQVRTEQIQFAPADGPNSRIDAPEENCSLKTVRGSYGFTTTGSIVSAGPVGLVADVGVLTFDGLGGVSQTETLSLNGTIILERISISGDYTVDDNCTGDMTVIVPVAGAIASHFVIVGNGRSLRAIVTGAGRVLTTVADKQ
jgi:hypothetical protein